MNEYYVYIAYQDTIPRYIGFGKGRRFEHVNSGVSASYRLNKEHFAGAFFDVHIVKNNLSSKDAQTLEIELIKYHGLLRDGGTLYNETLGGIGFRAGHTEKMKEIISNASKKCWAEMTPEDRAERKRKFLENGKGTRFQKGQKINPTTSKTWKIKNLETGEELQFKNKQKFMRDNPDYAFLKRQPLGVPRKGHIIEEVV